MGSGLDTRHAAIGGLLLYKYILVSIDWVLAALTQLPAIVFSLFWNFCNIPAETELFEDTSRIIRET